MVTFICTNHSLWGYIEIQLRDSGERKNRDLSEDHTPRNRCSIKAVFPSKKLCVLTSECFSFGFWTVQGENDGASDCGCRTDTVAS